MQLTKHTDFALRSLMYLGALPKGQLATITEISEQFNIPRNHLMKVVHQLGKLEYIETLRGPKGGIRLKKNAAEIITSRIEYKILKPGWIPSTVIPHPALCMAGVN